MLLEEGESGGEAFTSCLTGIHAAGQDLLRRVNELLDPTRVEAGELDVTPQALDAAGATPTGWDAAGKGRLAVLFTALTCALLRA
jgi:hypothetical protein